MKTVAVAIVCKTPAPGKSKTRLSPPLRPEECASISSCFIQDLSRTIGLLAQDADVTGVALYTPRGSEAALRTLLPDDFELTAQCDGDFGERLLQGTVDLLAAGHAGAILVNSDSPTLPRQAHPESRVEMKKLERDGWQERLRAGEWMPSPSLREVRHGGHIA